MKLFELRHFFEIVARWTLFAVGFVFTCLAIEHPDTFYWYALVALGCFYFVLRD